jgi:hypothetical protein
MSIIHGTVLFITHPIAQMSLITVTCPICETRILLLNGLLTRNTVKTVLRLLTIFSSGPHAKAEKLLLTSPYPQ